MSNESYRYRSPANLEPDVNIPDNVLPISEYWQTQPSGPVQDPAKSSCEVDPKSGMWPPQQSAINPQNTWVKVFIGAVAGVVIKKLLEKG